MVEVTFNIHQNREDVVHVSLSFPDDCLQQVEFAVGKAFEDLCQLQYEIAYEHYLNRFEEHDDTE